jgi:hypothetical protein
MVGSVGPDVFVSFSADLARIEVNSVELVNQSDGSLAKKVTLSPQALTPSFIPQSDGITVRPAITVSVTCNRCR